MEKNAKLLPARPEERLEQTLSVSKVKVFGDEDKKTGCKRQYKFTYIDKLPKKDWEFLTFGKFLHEILEVYYKARIDGNSDPDNILLAASWKKSFPNWKAKLSKESIDEAKIICNQFLKALFDKKVPKTIQGVEESFYIDIEGKILLNGFIDVVQTDPDGVLHLADYKTTKDKKYLKNDYFQLLTYAFVKCLQDPNLQVVRASYIMLRHNFDYMTKEFKRDEIMSIHDTFLEYGKKIEAERLWRPTTSFLCNYCSYQDICEEGSRVPPPGGNKNKKKFVLGESDW